VSYPLRLSEESLQSDFRGISPALADMGFLQRVNHATEAECPGCERTCLETVTPSEGKLYISCPHGEAVGIIEVKKAQINRFEVALKPILEWMAKELNVSSGVQPVKDGESWFLGKRKGGESSAHFYFLRSDSPDQAAKFNDKVQKENPVVLWLGETPHTGAFPENIVPLEEVFEVRGKSFFLNRRLLSKLPSAPRHTVGAGTILLDKNIALEKTGEVPYLLFEREGNVFQQRKRIRPQAFGLIRFLHTVRTKRENAFTLQTLADRLSIANKRTVSTRIREINDLCDEMDAKPIFHKFPGDKWGLNPNLV
jgi:hypothetical protein